jgi:hypothetical protein
VLRAERVDRCAAIQAADGPAVLATVVATAQQVGVTISDLSVVQPDLEDVFLRLTGKALRD